MTDKRIHVKPIIRQNSWLGPGHDGEFMFSGTTYNPVVPRNSYTGAMVDPFAGMAKEDIAVIAEKLALNPQDFNVNKKENNFWANRGPRLTKDETILDLSTVEGFINYRILLCDTDHIAKSWQERNDKQTYKFALVDASEEAKTRRATADEKKNAYIRFGSFNNDVNKMKDFINFYYNKKRLPNRIGTDWKDDHFVSEVSRILEDDTHTFLDITNSPMYNEEIFVMQLVEKGILEYKNAMYYIVGEPQPVGNYDTMVKFLHDKKNNETKLQLKAKLDRAKG